MKLIIGLGNLGKRYEKTRHNVGFMVVDVLAQELGITNYELSKKAKALCAKVRIKEEVIELIKPQTFMNESGISVAYVRNKHKVPFENVYIIHDDLDIALGEYKIQKGKGPKEHNGIISIDKALGTRDYWHVRIGIENRNQESTRLPTLGRSDCGQGIKNQEENKAYTIHQIPNTPRPSGEEYVLQNFTEKELKIIDDVAVKIVEELLNNVLNR